MSKHPKFDSVDLTKDENEDSRDTVIEPEINSSCNLQSNNILVNASLPPPLKPIPKVSTPAAKVISTKVPTLTKIPSNKEPGFETHSTIIQSQQSTTPTQVPAAGKLVLIKKNNKLYKIIVPHNVMPTTCQTGGPVIINIPEVGPLVIKIDPRIRREPTTKFAAPLDPLLLNFDEIIERATEAEVLDIAPPGLCCWEKIKKQNGKTCGFSKRDYMSTKKCFNALNLLINQKKEHLQEQLRYHKIKKIKTVQNNPIFQKHSHAVNSNNNDFLVTKKVRKLDGYTTKKIKNKKSKVLATSKVLLQFSQSGQGIPISIEQNYKEFIIPCEISMTRSRIIENLLDQRKKCLPLSKIEDITCRQEILEFFIIKNNKQFTNEIVYTKPLSILNVHNFAIKFETECSKTNLVFPINVNEHLPKEVLENSQFFSAVTKGYIKLVKSSVFRSYLNGETGPFNLI